MKYNTLITILGWIIFIIALTVYLFTLEPANSFWDCSEFIACAYKLQVSHSPGAPFYMLIARLFALFAGYDNSGLYMYDLYPDGSLTQADDFISSGSGSVMAYGVLETQYKANMSIDEGVKLAVKAINAALQRDSASGNGLDVVVIDKSGVKKFLTKELNTFIEI